VIAELKKKMNRLLEAHRAGQPVALLSDYDGTLVPIVEHPSLARLPLGTRDVLHRLAMQPRAVVGILSGRRIDDLKEMVGLSSVCYSGVSGLELELDGIRIAHPHAAEGRAVIAGLAAPLGALAAAYPGAWVEDKRLGLTLHYRAAAAHHVSALRARAKELLQSLGERLHVVDVAMAIEITPALGWTKGSAVRTIVAHAGSGAVPLYAGDEANDRDGLEAAIALGGIAIGIGPRAPSGAGLHLSDSAAFVNLLSGLLEVLERPATRLVNSLGFSNVSEGDRAAHR
jgi:trehalose 6-phosphate phosphatase